MHEYVCMSVCVALCLCMYLCMCECKCMRVCVCVCVCACMCVRMHMCGHTRKEEIKYRHRILCPEAFFCFRVGPIRILTKHINYVNFGLAASSQVFIDATDVIHNQNTAKHNLLCSP